MFFLSKKIGLIAKYASLQSCSDDSLFFIMVLASNCICSIAHAITANEEVLSGSEMNYVLYLVSLTGRLLEEK